MTFTPFVKRWLAVEELPAYLKTLKFTSWKPSGMVLHNTWQPRLEDWPGKVSRDQRLINLERYYRVEQKWSAGPHAFIDDYGIGLATPFNERGIHSPSWNGTRIGIEMVGNYDEESVVSGRGLKVWKNTVALFGLLHAEMGWDPDSIKFHREDPKTTHKDCPGKNISKDGFIRAVEEFMGHGGEHGPDPIPPAYTSTVIGVSDGDTLNVRDKSSMSGKKIGELKNGAKVRVVSEARNGETLWLRIETGSLNGWVSGRYVEK